MTYEDWIIEVVTEDLGLNDDEILQLEDIVYGRM